MDREAWRAAVHGVAKSRTRLSDWTTAFLTTAGLGPVVLRLHQERVQGLLCHLVTLSVRMTWLLLVTCCSFTPWLEQQEPQPSLSSKGRGDKEKKQTGWLGEEMQTKSFQKCYSVPIKATTHPLPLHRIGVLPSFLHWSPATSCGGFSHLLSKNLRPRSSHDKVPSIRCLGQIGQVLCHSKRVLH